MRALPEEFWVKGHREGANQHPMTPEEMAENAAFEKQQKKLREEKRARVLKEREAVKVRAAMLAKLEQDKKPLIEKYLAEVEAAKEKSKLRTMI